MSYDVTLSGNDLSVELTNNVLSVDLTKTGSQGPAGPAGIDGTDGVDGAEGLKGDTGATGDTGAKGDDGDTGPQGIQGIQGDQGIQGETGTQGIQGIQGDTGDTGPQGIQGETGAQGIQGIQGGTGATGDTGATGAQGVGEWKGDWLTATSYLQYDLVAEAGTSYIATSAHTSGVFATDVNNNYWTVVAAKGDAGADGADGAQGIQGIQGIQGDEGPTGTHGIQGIQGDTGADSTVAGPQGDTGAQGIQGIQGIQGDAGADGVDGAQGIQGIQGIQGEDGVSGDGVLVGAQGTATTDISGSSALLTWDTPHITSADVTVSGSEITSVNGGDYVFMVPVGVSGGSNRVELSVTTEIDTGAGWGALPANSAFNYAVRAADQDDGDTVLIFPITLAAGNKLRFTATAVVDGGAANLSPNQTRLIIITTKGEKGDKGDQGDPGSIGSLTTTTDDANADFVLIENTGGTNYKIAPGNIPLSLFDNDSGFTANTGDITNVTAGVGLSGGGSSGAITLTVDLAELFDMTATMTGTDEFIVLDNAPEVGNNNRKAANEINLSIFNNDLGLVIGTDVQAYDVDILKADVSDNLTAGFTSDEEALTFSSGTFNPDTTSTKENYKTITNNGAHTWDTPTPTKATSFRVRVVNGVSAGIITTSNYDNTYGTYATTASKEYWAHIEHDGTRSTISWSEIV